MRALAPVVRQTPEQRGTVDVLAKRDEVDRVAVDLFVPVLGVSGASVGGAVGIVAGFGGVNDLKIGGLLLSLLGSMLVLSGYRIIAKRSTV